MINEIWEILGLVVAICGTVVVIAGTAALVYGLIKISRE